MYFQTLRLLVGCSSFSYIGWGIKVSEWVLNQSWGLPVLLAFLVIVFVFESRKAFKAYQEKRRFELGWALLFALVALLAIIVLLAY
ncbi:hypothetical protein [Paenibacillus sp. HGF5]|uniref:hypothetical protein n=1 Tax=Paenibacillus sp. HGF5 TaxID=908341 RepID=UPI00020729B3|nr:hypothetical protein [Paenibacillus sp. HGF5]EGG38267.1 hypothetical protein HMPREF9412_0890 [Paenibacillus sp. HGF5]